MPDKLDDKFLVIRNHGFFASISDEDYEQLNFEHHFKETKKGEYIYFESMYNNKLFFVKGGFVKIGTIDEEGNEIIKEIIGEGEIFGQYTLEKEMNNGEFAQAYKSDVSLCAFTIDDFQQLLIDNPNLTLKFSKEIGKKIKVYESRVLGLLNKDVRSRLASFLISVFKQENINIDVEKELSMDNIFTHEDIASLIGSSRQTVTTIINEFEQEEVLQFNRQIIVIKNLNYLKNLAGVI